MSKKYKAQDVIDSHDPELLQSFLNENAWAKDIRPGFAGGGWMHYAASFGTPELLDVLIENGFDLNDAETSNGERPIVCAARDNNLDNVKFFVSKNAIIDVDKSVRNPLFASIVAGNENIALIILGTGIDAQIQYSSDTMTNMDAISFAIWRNEGALAGSIANYVANITGESEEALIEDARKRADENGPLSAIPIVPPKGYFDE